MKFTTALMAGALLALSGTALVYGQTAPAPTPQQRETRHIRRDSRDIRHDRRDVRRDQRRVNRAVATGHYRRARAQVRDMRRDKRDIRHDRRKRRVLRHVRHVQNKKGPGAV